MIVNRYNWIALLRVFYVFVNPAQFLVAIIRREAPSCVTVRSPIGHLRLELRNFESLRTLFSIFCRRDYHTRADRSYHFLDVGANIGLASAYFLSRNQFNTATCVEPDRENLDLLKRNLLPFGARAQLCEYAVAETAGHTTLYCSDDGKYSSLVPSERAVAPQRVETRAFSDLLEEASAQPLPVAIKLDVEGMETKLVDSVQFEHFLRVQRLICESVECSQLIRRHHQRVVRAGYVEDLWFRDQPA